MKKLLIGEDTLAARALFLQALELDSAYAPAWFRLSSVTPDGDPQGTAWARRAYRLDSLNKWYGQLYGQKLLAEGELDKARPLFVRLSALDPTNPDNIRILAILYQQAGMPYSAIDMLDSAEMRFGKMPLLGAMKRQLLIRTGQLDRALAEAREMAEAIPYEAENHVILADLYGAAKQDSLAIAEYNRALEIDSMNVPALASLAEFYNKRNDSHAYLAVSKRLFEIDELPLSEKVRIFRQLTLDVRFYRDNFFQLNDLISTLAIRYPDDKDVVELYAQHLINAGELEQALTLYKLHLADQPPQLDYYRAVIDIETYRKRLDSVYLYIDRVYQIALISSDLSRSVSASYAGALHSVSEKATPSYTGAFVMVLFSSSPGSVGAHPAPQTAKTAAARRHAILRPLFSVPVRIAQPPDRRAVARYVIVHNVTGVLHVVRHLELNVAAVGRQPERAQRNGAEHHVPVNSVLCGAGGLPGVSPLRALHRGRAVLAGGSVDQIVVAAKIALSAEIAPRGDQNVHPARIAGLMRGHVFLRLNVKVEVFGIVYDFDFRDIVAVGAVRITMRGADRVLIVARHRVAGNIQIMRLYVIPLRQRALARKVDRHLLILIVLCLRIFITAQIADQLQVEVIAVRVVQNECTR